MSRALPATALLAAGGLVVEVALTRVLSVMFYSNFVFLVLSVAVLGLGLGAAAGALRPSLRRAERLGTAAMLASLSASLLLVLTVLVPVPAVALAFAAVPFAFAGLALAGMFSLHAEQSFRLYWADLVGAGIGTLLAFALLSLLGGSSGLLAGSVLLAAAAMILRAPWVPALVPVLLILANVTTAWLDPLPTASKPLRAALADGGVITATRWDAFARSDLVRMPGDSVHYLYMDGAAGSLVPRMVGQQLWRSDAGLLPFAADAPDSAFLLGPGGGLDVALARSSGTGRIVAAELNAGGLRLVDALDDGIYAGVELHIDEGRSVLRRLGELFELIFLSHVITQTSDPRGYALSEASVYTKEAFHDYLDHLTPGGQVAIKLYDEVTLTRAFLTAIQVLVERGATEQVAARHLFAVLDTRTTPPLPLLLIRDAPLERDAAVALARTAESLGLALLFVPDLLAQPPLDGLLAGAVDSADLIAAAGANLAAATDARPFFFQFERGLPRGLLPLAAGTLLLVLAFAAWRLFARRRPAGDAQPVTPSVFALLGAGFMTLELSILQRSQLYLGHPTLALTVVLGALLVGSGTGSLLAGRLLRGLSGTNRLKLGSGLVVVIAPAWYFAWPWLGSVLPAADLTVRALLAAASILPLALVLGVPFPAALVMLRSRPRAVAAAWAVNGVASVAGSVVTVVLAILYGYPVALALAIACYAGVFMLAARPQARRSTSQVPSTAHTAENASMNPSAGRISAKPQA